MQTDYTEPIFVVGAPRSGTTLLAAMLAAHSRLSCGPETRFFHFLAKTDPAYLLASWPENAVDFLYSIVLIEPVPDHYGVSREEIYAYLADQQPGVQAILMALTKQLMHRASKQRWVEKSPEHLRVIGEVREYFPKAPIIRILRDPRDVALSLIRTPWAPQDYLDALMYWRKYDDQSQSFFQTDENCFSLHYEDLVLDPQRELRQLCAFIGEGFEVEMLNTTAAAARVATAGEPWKNHVYQPIDESRTQVWKRELDMDQNRISESLVGDRLAAYGYDCVTPWAKTALVYPSLELMLRYRDSLAMLSRTKIQLRSDSKDSDMVVFVGNPDGDRWLSFRKPDRWLDMLDIFIEIARRKLARQPVVWVGEDVDRIGYGWSTRLITFVLQVTGDRFQTVDR